MKQLEKRLGGCLLILFFTLSVSAQRDMVWLDGSPVNSISWIDMRQHMSNFLGYDFDNRVAGNILTYNNGSMHAANQIDAMVDGHVNVLGIAHDYGGIVLRRAQHISPEITAMILDGVPNQGSRAISNTTNPLSPEDTRAQRLIREVIAIQSGDDCSDCGVDESFQSWIDGIAASADHLIEVRDDSDIIEELNQSANLPTVPYVVLYGTVEDGSPLTSFLSSRAFPSNDDYFTECYQRELNEALTDAHNAIERARIRRTTGLFASVATFISEIVSFDKNTLSTTIVSSIANFIDGETNAAIDHIEEIEELDRELARVLRCRLSMEILQSEWDLLLLDGTIVEEEIDNSTDIRTCCRDYAEWDCYGEHYSGCEAAAYRDCIENEIWHDLCPELLNATQFVFSPEPHDGLLTRREQLLDGNMQQASSPYHLQSTNHFEETMRSQVVVVQTLQDLFNGGAGAAFVVPTI